MYYSYNVEYSRFHMAVELFGSIPNLPRGIGMELTSTNLAFVSDIFVLNHFQLVKEYYSFLERLTKFRPFKKKYLSNSNIENHKRHKWVEFYVGIK